MGIQKGSQIIERFKASLFRGGAEFDFVMARGVACDFR